MGVLGASNWRKVFEVFAWPLNACAVLIPDNDTAGNSWKEGFLDALKERCASVHVVQPKENDLTDQLRKTPTTQAELINLFKQIAA